MVSNVFVSVNNNMLNRVRRALGHEGTIAPFPMQFLSPCPAEQATETDLARLFCEELVKVGGHASVVAKSEELKSALERIMVAEKPDLVALSDIVASVHEQLFNALRAGGIRFLSNNSLNEFETYKRELLSAGVGITTADYAIADTGTLVLLSGGERHRLVSLLPPVHVCLLDARRIFPNLAALLAHLREQVYSDESSPQATTFITGPSRTADIEQTLTTGVHGPYRLEVLLTNGFDWR
jgi:L-lactate dehydrogenase complex protein LldG